MDLYEGSFKTIFILNIRIILVTLFFEGIFTVKAENYKSLRKALKGIVRRIKKLKHITIDGKHFKIKYTQGGDLKWLANMNGINAANSNHLCVWCRWNCKSTLDYSKEWSISGRRGEVGVLGCKHDPIIDFINFHSCIVDPLHLNDCRISTPMFFCKRTKKMKLRSLNKNEREKILNVLTESKDLLELFNDHADDAKLVIFNFVLVEFYKFFIFIKQDHSENFDKNLLIKKLKAWLKQYVRCTDGEKLIPYVHIFVFHVPEFIEVYKNLNLYSMQALEKLNSITKSNYFKQTNRRPMLCLLQLLQKANRTEFTHLKSHRLEFE